MLRDRERTRREEGEGRKRRRKEAKVGGTKEEGPDKQQHDQQR